MFYVIKIQKWCWIAPWDGDPGRTLIFENAKKFRSLEAATRAKNKIITENPHRKLNLEIQGYETAKKEVNPERRIKTLTLNLKKEYFEQIKSGIKTEEYRACTPYWSKRLGGKSFDKIIIKLGYPKNSEVEKIMEFTWNGYEIKEIIHKHFGYYPVKVYAIKLKGEKIDEKI